ncbi:hypothetical protein HUT16_05385 [Kitasatospora sp. NA04385]|uniref:hypothetical protein n=1 Tax=Kitasatospora sp. NA04385 TaxID=2742135 RepID=UPI0015925A29|nr:hypothetical protein [Kitasatospora sp. NA04385]QKW18569.1 hypothetical protein HUT16_05385 [Kitasatospora sp. NA04385]
MAKRRKGGERRRPDASCFVQVVRRPSLGVEVSTGRAWAGVDQQVGHGSADALFALTEQQYAAALAGEGLGSFEGECWRGGHDDLLLFHPGSGSWSPERWYPARDRMLPPRFEGELWWHVDALDAPADSPEATAARRLAAGTDRAVFRLTGEGAYPRPAALIGGLGPGSDRARARAVLGEPVEEGGDVHAVEGDRVRLGYLDGALATIALERPAPQRLPEGPVRALLAVLGEPEGGPAFRAAARLAGGAHRRWASSSGLSRRLLAFDGGGQAQVEDGRVLSVRLPAPGPLGLLPGSRTEVHRVLGAPSATHAGTDLHRYGSRDLLVAYGPEFDSARPGAAPVTVTAVPRGVSVARDPYRWRSGEFTLFLDVLGRPESHPLVERVRALPGVRLAVRRGLVAQVVVGDRGHRAERLAAFVDGMPAEPARGDVPFGLPRERGERDDLREFAEGWIHVHCADGTAVSTVTVAQEPPPVR